jgi:very-short-patch-repair endonuclease
VLEARRHAWRREQILESFGRRATDRALAEGAILRVLPGVYAPAHRAHELFTMASAVSTWVEPHAAVGGAAAAHVLGITERPVPHVTVCAPHEFLRSVPSWVRLRRATVTVPHRRVRRVRVVAAQDAVIQGWEDLHASQRTGFVLDAIRDGHVSSEGLRRRLAAYPRVKGRRALSHLLDLAVTGVTSFLEHRARTQVFVGAAFREFAWQAPLNASGRNYIADLLHRRAAVVIELDGAAHHSGDLARRRDIERDAHMAAAGYQTLRFTYDDIVRRPAWCRSLALSTVRARLPRAAG